MYNYLTYCMSYIYNFFIKLTCRTLPDYEEAFEEPYFSL